MADAQISLEDWIVKVGVRCRPQLGLLPVLC